MFVRDLRHPSARIVSRHRHIAYGATQGALAATSIFLIGLIAVSPSRVIASAVAAVVVCALVVAAHNSGLIARLVAHLYPANAADPELSVELDAAHLQRLTDLVNENCAEIARLADQAGEGKIRRVA